MRHRPKDPTNPALSVGPLLAIGLAMFQAAIFTVLLSPVGRGFSWMWAFNQVVRSALNGRIDPSSESRFQWACGTECDDWLPMLPAATSVGCLDKLTPDGACCTVLLGDRIRTEVHIYRLPGNRYRIAPRVPRCLHPDSDPPADTWRSRWVRCDDNWGVSATAVDSGL